MTNYNKSKETFIEMNYRGFKLFWTDHGLERAAEGGRQYEDERCSRNRAEFSLRNFISFISLTKGSLSLIGEEPQFIKFIDKLNNTAVVIQFIPAKKTARIKTCYKAGEHCGFKEFQKNAVLDSEGFRLYAEADKNEIGEKLCEYNFAEKGIQPSFFKVGAYMF